MKAIQAAKGNGGAAALRLRQNRMAHASECLSQIGSSGLRYVEQPVTIEYTAEFVAATKLHDGQQVKNTAAVPKYFGVPEAERVAQPTWEFREYSAGSHSSDTCASACTGRDAQIASFQVEIGLSQEGAPTARPSRTA